VSGYEEQAIHAFKVCTSIFMVCGLLVIIPLFDLCELEMKRIGEKIMNNKKSIMVAWAVNFLAFTVCLWVGEYAMYAGVAWIKTPCSITLLSLGIFKVLLTILLCVCFLKKDKSPLTEDQ